MPAKKSIKTFRSSDFVALLDTEFRKLYGTDEKARKKAFEFVGHPTTARESHLDDIEAFYNGLPESTQCQFKRAIHDLMSSGKLGDFPLEAMRDLIYLIRRVHYVDGYDLFLSVIAQGEWGQQNPDLIHDCFANTPSQYPGLREQLLEIWRNTNPRPVAAKQ